MRTVRGVVWFRNRTPRLAMFAANPNASAVAGIFHRAWRDLPAGRIGQGMCAVLAPHPDDESLSCGGLETGCSIGFLTRMSAPRVMRCQRVDLIEQPLDPAHARCACQPWVWFHRQPRYRLDLRR